MKLSSKNVSPRRKKIGTVLAVIVGIGIAGQTAVDFGLLDGVKGMFASTSTSTGSTMADLVGSPTPQSSAELGSSLSTNQPVVRRVEPVPLMEAKTFDELAQLYMLSSRVQNENKTAAQIAGLQRISIRAKREQLKELELAAQIAKIDYERTKAETDKTLYSAKVTNSDSTIRSTSDLPAPGNDPRLRNQYDPNYNSPTDARFVQPTREVEAGDVYVRAMIDGKAHITIGKEDFSSVRVGHTLLARFKINGFDKRLECVSVTDLKDDIQFNTCAR